MHRTNSVGPGLRAALLLALPAAFPAIAQDGCSLLPQPVETYAVGSSPTLVELADLDGDGRADLIVSAVDGVSVRPNLGEGAFGDPLPIRSVAGRGLFAADLDGDGDLDLATAEPGGLTILRNAGGFAFEAQAPLVVKGTASELAAADLDGDGDPDLVVGGGDGPLLTRFINDGLGGFGSPASFDAGEPIGGLAVGDLTGDGVPDAVVGLAGSLSVLPGEGDGRFGPPLALAKGRAGDVALSDLDADGDLDIVVFRSGINELAWLVNQGDGVFSRIEGPRLSEDASSLGIADVNGDGWRDVVFDAPLLGAVGVVRVRADGTMLPPAYFASGSSPHRTDRPIDIAVADIDGDGDADVAAANEGGGSVGVLRNVAGRFEPHRAVITQATEVILVVDLTGDGRPEVVSSGDGFAVLRAGPDGQLSELQKLPRFADRLAAGDIDGDGDQDVIAYDNFLQPGIHTLFNIGGGVLSAHQPRLRVTGVGDLETGDVDGDGLADLAYVDLWGDRVVVLRSRGDGSFASSQVVDLGADHTRLAFADMNGDGHLDLVSATGTPLSSGEPPAIHVLLNDGAGMLVALPPDLGAPTLDMAVADVDADGAPEVITTDGLTVTVRWNDGGGRFGHRTSADAPGLAVVAVADIDGVGFAEVMGATDPEPQGELLAWPISREAFGTPSSIVLPAPAWSIDAADLDGDGRTDTMVGSRGARVAAARLMAFAGRPPCIPPCPADLDGDGALTIFDFLAFQNLFDLMDPAADFDGDGEFTIFDFLAFQNAFDLGCP